jgi:hypothetical protein
VVEDRHSTREFRAKERPHHGRARVVDAPRSDVRAFDSGVNGEQPPTELRSQRGKPKSPGAPPAGIRIKVASSDFGRPRLDGERRIIGRSKLDARLDDELLQQVEPGERHLDAVNRNTFESSRTGNGTASAECALTAFSAFLTVRGSCAVLAPTGNGVSSTTTPARPTRVEPVPSRLRGDSAPTRVRFIRPIWLVRSPPTGHDQYRYPHRRRDAATHPSADPHATDFPPSRGRRPIEKSYRDLCRFDWGAPTPASHLVGDAKFQPWAVSHWCTRAASRQPRKEGPDRVILRR